MKKSIFLKLNDILQTNFLINERAFNAGDLISEDLGLNRYEFQELIWYLENEYNLSLPDPEVASLRTVRDLVLCVDNHLQNSVLYPLFLAEVEAA